MQFMPISTGFPYRMTFVPYRGRKATKVVMKGVAGAAIRSISREEASDAFRLTYPFLDRRPLLNKAGQRGYWRGSVREPETVTLLEYAGDFWTPNFCADASGEIDADDAVKEMLDGIESGHQLNLMEPNHELPRDTGASAFARRVVSDGYEQALTAATRRVLDNFLICDGLPYTRTGSPVYVRRQLSRRTWEIDIDHSIFDRTIDRTSVSVASNDLDILTDEAIRTGPIWLADERKSALAASHPKQDGIPLIENLTGRPSDDLRLVIRVDALLRETLRMFRRPFAERWNSIAAKEFRVRMLRTRPVEGSDNDLTSRRFEALGLFFKHASSETDCSHLKEAKMAFLTLLAEIEKGEMPPPLKHTPEISFELDPVDETALADLFS